MERRLRVLLLSQFFFIIWYRLSEADEVEFPPTFTQKPSGLVVPDGVRASLNCSASGNPPPSYEWLSGLDNKRVVSTDHRRYITPDGNLIFNPFNSSLDQTVYYCKAENSLSSITSEGVLLAVASSPAVTRGPRNATVKEKDDVAFTCAGSGFPSPNYRWKRGDDASFSQDGASLRLGTVSPSDAGEYSCEVYNVAGTATAGAFLHVQYPPSASVSPSQTVAHHETPSLTCNFKGFPTVSVRWLKDGQILERQHTTISTVITAPRIGEGMSQLTLKNLHKQDSGTYTCQVSNDLGSGVGETHLLVQFPPDPPTLYPAGIDGTAVNLTWSPAQPSPSPPISGFLILYRHQDQATEERKEKSVPGADTRGTSVAGLKKGKTYYFRVAVSNSVGQSDLSNVVTASIAATVPDAAPVFLSATSLSTHSIHLKWMQPAQSNGGAPITGYTIEYRALSATEWIPKVVEGDVSETTVGELSSNTSYVFKVSAVNAVGSSQPSSIVPAKTSIIGSPSAVDDVVVNDSDETSATVSWIIPDTSLEENEHIERYIIHLSAEQDAEDRVTELSAPFDTLGNRIVIELDSLLPNVTYHITVSAANRQGDGPQSSSVSFTTQARAATDHVGVNDNGREDIGSPKNIVADNVAYIAAGIAVIVVFVAGMVVVIVWRCHRVSTDDSASSTVTMKSDLESPISTLPPYAYSPAKQSSSSYSKPLPDPSIVTVKEAFEQALSPTPPPASVMADFVNAFSSIGNDTLGEEQIPSNIGSRVNSMYEELHPGLRKTETGRSRSLSVDRVSESSDETIKKRNVTFGSPDLSPVRPQPSSPTRTLPSNPSYSQRGIMLNDIHVELDSYV